ncbi:MAG: hypothetical protein AB8B65_16805 [Kordia sp.]|uniref:hypothetical protein n=1 Tax=Kordia sp. TaxID=1965332 RepID=UPI00385BE857
MKKARIKLSLNKKNISNLETAAIVGGVTGRTCNYTNKYYNTCYDPCSPPPASRRCGNTVFVCDM